MSKRHPAKPTAMSAQIQVMVPASAKRQWAQAAKRERLPLARWATRALAAKARAQGDGRISRRIMARFLRRWIKYMGLPRFQNERQLLRSLSAKPKLMDTAYHEAGHAVAAIALGLPLASITIVPTKDFLGRYEWGAYQWPIAAREIRRRRMQHMIVSAAGLAAQRRHGPGLGCLGACGDLKQGVDMAMDISRCSGEAVKQLKVAATRAEKIVSRNWPAVRRMARALMAKRTLVGPEAQAIFQGA